jgi:RNA polymerase sigma-70 factor (ECF subfamily)
MDAQREQEFEALYRREHSRLVHLAYGMLGDRGLAQDAAQEAWIRYLRYLDGERPQFSIPLLITVALNVARDWARRRSRHLEDLRPDVTAEAPPYPAHRDLLDAVRRLPSPEREAVVMHYALDMPVAEVAAVLGKRAGTVKSLLRRARGHLRALLTPEEGIADGR